MAAQLTWDHGCLFAVLPLFLWPGGCSLNFDANLHHGGPASPRQYTRAGQSVVRLSRLRLGVMAFRPSQIWGISLPSAAMADLIASNFIQGALERYPERTCE